MGGGAGSKKWKPRPLYQTQPEVYGKVKWIATSECVNLFKNLMLNLKNNETDAVFEEICKKKEKIKITFPTYADTSGCETSCFCFCILSILLN